MYGERMMSMNNSKTAKRQAIEKEIRDIVLSDKKMILKDNLRRRHARLGNLKKGDCVTLYEFFRNRKKEFSDEGELLYRLVEGRIIQVTKSGFYIEGVSHRGALIREYVNKSHIINGTVKLAPKEKRID